MRYLTLIILITLATGCTSVEIQQARPITKGQIFVEEFTGAAGGIVTNVIEIEFQKKGLLTTQNEAKYILSGDSNFPGWTDGIAFELKDKSGNLYFRGNATSGGFLLLREVSKDVAKEICKKFKKSH